jgi:hypothetical protein
MNNSNSDLIDKLEIRLSKLSTEWRKVASESGRKEAEPIVNEYHKVMDELWMLGWDGGDLLPDSELPSELMPKYFLEKWRKK